MQTIQNDCRIWRTRARKKMNESKKKERKKKKTRGIGAHATTHYSGKKKKQTKQKKNKDPKPSPCHISDAKQRTTHILLVSSKAKPCQASRKVPSRRNWKDHNRLSFGHFSRSLSPPQKNQMPTHTKKINSQTSSLADIKPRGVDTYTEIKKDYKLRPNSTLGIRALPSKSMLQGSNHRHFKNVGSNSQPLLEAAPPVRDAGSKPPPPPHIMQA
jgi:hypothetical protein